MFHWLQLSHTSVQFELVGHLHGFRNYEQFVVEPVIVNELKAITVTGSETKIFGSRTRKAFQI